MVVRNDRLAQQGLGNRAPAFSASSSTSARVEGAAASQNRHLPPLVDQVGRRLEVGGSGEHVRWRNRSALWPLTLSLER